MTELIEGQVCEIWFCVESKEYKIRFYMFECVVNYEGGG